MLGAIGLEFEIAERAFTDLVTIYEEHMQSDAPEWVPPREQIPSAAGAARALVDHATRLQRMIGRFYARNTAISQWAEEFRTANQPLFDLRNALHHQDERIETGEAFAQLQPTFGDVSWIAWAERSELDVYWMSFGPLVGEQRATVAFGEHMIERRGLNEIIYRAFDHEARLAAAFLSLIALVEKTHDEILRLFDAELAKLGIKRGGPADKRLPAEMGGRIRLAGLVGASREEAST